MDPVALAFGALATALTAWALRGTRLLVPGSLVVASAVLLSLAGQREEVVGATLPDAAGGADGYASSSTCRTCHPGAYATWHQSYHRRMTEPATATSVLAPFDGRAIEVEGLTYRVFERDGAPWVDMPRFHTDGDRPDERWRLPVTMVTGSHHMQAFWITPPLPPPTAAEERAYEAVCARCHAAGPGPLLHSEGLSEDAVQARFDEAHLVEERAPDAMRLVPFTEDRLMLTVEDVSDVEAALGRVMRTQHLSPFVQFPLVYLTQDERWLHEEHSFLRPDAPVGPVQDPGDGWGNGCDACHASGVVYALDDGLEVDSRAADLGIACESCHGPGAEHVRRMQDPLARYGVGDGDGVEHGELAITNPARLDRDRADDVCAACHADVESRAPGAIEHYRPGDDLNDYVTVMALQHRDDAFMEDLLEEDAMRLRGSFWPDGTGRVAGRTFNEHRMSACVKRGALGCRSCHDMHTEQIDDQLDPGARGDAICLDCHDAMDERAHTRHARSSSGSRCQSCHMPYTTYGLFKAIRSHRIDSPALPTAAQGERPNACNLCHLDRSLAWTRQQLQERFEVPMKDAEPLPPEGASRAAGLWWLLEGDGVQRTLAAWHMRWSPAREAEAVSDVMVGGLLVALDDPYGAVRYQSARSLRALVVPTLTGALEGYRFDEPADLRRPIVTAAIARWRGRDDRRVALLDRLRASAEARDTTPVQINE